MLWCYDSQKGQWAALHVPVKVWSCLHLPSPPLLPSQQHGYGSWRTHQELCQILP